MTLLKFELKLFKTLNNKKKFKQFLEGLNYLYIVSVKMILQNNYHIKIIKAYVTKSITEVGEALNW